MTPQRRHHGFTLVELLVIVSIITIALGILLTGMRDLFASGAANKAENVVDAQLSMARSLAIRDRCYTGVAFWPDAKDPNQQWAVIVQEALQDPINPVYQSYQTGGRPSLYVSTPPAVADPNRGDIANAVEEDRLRSWGPQDARRLFVQVRSKVTYPGRGIASVIGTPGAPSLRLQGMQPGTHIRVGDYVNLNNVGYRIRNDVVVPSSGPDANTAKVNLVSMVMPPAPLPTASTTLNFKVESSSEAEIPPAKLPEGVVVARDTYSACDAWANAMAPGSIWPAAAPWPPDAIRTFTTFVVLFAPDGKLVTAAGEVQPRFVLMPDVNIHNDFCADTMFCWRDRNLPTPATSETWQFLNARGSLDQLTAGNFPTDNTVPVTAVRLVNLQDFKRLPTTNERNRYLDEHSLLPVGPYVGGLLRPQ